MKTKQHRRGGFTLVEIMIVVAIIGLLAAIAIPNFVKARKTAQGNACVNNLRQIDAAIQQYALENNKSDDYQVTPDQVAKYMRGEILPTCPTGNTAYTLPDNVKGTVSCSNWKQDEPGHKLGQLP